MISDSTRSRLRIAGQAAERLLSSHPGTAVWLEGALACGLAHATSDIDLRLLGDAPDLPGSRSWLSDGVRIDLQVSTPDQMEQLRGLLRGFDVRADDLALFRRVRRDLPALTCLRTAKRYQAGQWIPVINSGEAEVYRAWGVADRAETVASLTEDLIGLIVDGLYASADLVLERLALTLASAECAAAGQPLLGEKWLPLMADQPWSPRPLSALWQDTSWGWFRPIQRRLTSALLSCHLVNGASGEPNPVSVSGSGWLPQRYSDGWFLRRADDRVPLTDAALLAWAKHLESATA
ncbi:hypothetical protein ACGF07_10270 [Kitasatospora sp. NPDC048194]|uniref:hypothetical protein n=1 Tax=Kitasatospora sp. NPDC048194 TaxID=3364045 RepID=UPI00371D4C94